MSALLTAIVTWLSINLALPASYDHPRVELISPAQMDVVRSRGHGSARSPVLPVEVADRPNRESERAVEALYDDATWTIYLPTGWTGKTPAELSVLVHEMVHHLQNVAGWKYECPEAREKAAYVAQDKWLALFGRNLLDEFNLDPLTVLLRTKCMH